MEGFLSYFLLETDLTNSKPIFAGSRIILHFPFKELNCSSKKNHIDFITFSPMIRAEGNKLQFLRDSFNIVEKGGKKTQWHCLP